ncbi:MAG: hypothetical protein H0T98_08105 [Euzebyaceae bacterium]|nr:hypothetical protein [Euzebyaceae bacterium]
MVQRLDRLDSASRHARLDPPLLAAIEESPGLRSGDLAERLGDEQVRLKRRVRRLKDLGLTESLGIGYRLSPRGQAVTERLMGG